MNSESPMVPARTVAGRVVGHELHNVRSHWWWFLLLGE